MKQSFESQFPANYREKDIKKLLSLIFAGKFCQLLSLPGGGKATVLKLLAYNKSLQNYHLKENAELTKFFYFNLLELPNFKQATIDKFFLLSLGINENLPDDSLVLSEKLKEKINQTINNEQLTIVFLFDHFDEFQNQLDRQFFQRMRTLRSFGKYKFSAVFGTRRDLQELVDEQILKEFYDFFIGNAVYMTLFDKSACDFMFLQIENVLGKKLGEIQKENIIKLTGGHTKLLKVCTENVLTSSHPEFISGSNEMLKRVQHDMVNTPIINASLLELWHSLTPAEQQFLASGVALENLDFLENLGLIKNKKITIPLFAEFVKKIAATKTVEHFSINPQTKEITKGQTIISDLLSAQEFRLLKFAIENPDRILEREEIINAVWKEEKSTEGVTDQALDQLVFRLRKKIENKPNAPKHLTTIKGRGIKFTP